MRIKKDNHLDNLARTTEIEQNYLSTLIIRKCFLIGIIDDDEACYGITMKQAYIESDYDFDIEDLYFAVIGYGCKFSENCIGYFEKLTVLGDYDCPNCGAILHEQIHEDSKLIQHTYDSEPYQSIIEEICNNCNYKI